MTIPSEIPFSSIDPGVRARTQPQGIDELALDIEESGLIQPIVLVEKTPNLTLAYELEYQITLDPSQPYLLTAGGRRHCALSLLECSTLFHGSTSDPLRPGFLVRGEAPLIDQLILEAKENQNRQDMDWRDQLKLIVRAWRLAKREADERGETIFKHIFGATLGVDQATLSISDRLYNHFIANPSRYADANSVYQAMSILTKDLADEVTRVAIAKSMGTPAPQPSGLATKPNLSPAHELIIQTTGRIANALSPGQSPLLLKTLDEQVISLSSAFLHTDALAFMEAQREPFCDHIICDPDYALAANVLDSHPNNRPGIMADGIRQGSVVESLGELYKFITLSYKCLPDHGFLVFWYALDHHEKLLTVCKKVGFAVQEWPLIWNKIDFRGRSNAAPNQNFPKSTEFAMVCRKPGTVLAKVQNSCVFTTDGGSVTKALGHAYAKPFDLWRWIYHAVSVPGQTVFDPFVGSGSSAIAAIRFGLRPMGCEKDLDIYNKCIINLQSEYRKILSNPNVKFS